MAAATEAAAAVAAVAAVVQDAAAVTATVGGWEIGLREIGDLNNHALEQRVAGNDERVSLDARDRVWQHECLRNRFCRARTPPPMAEGANPEVVDEFL